MATTLTISAQTAAINWNFTNNLTLGNTTNTSNFSYSAPLTNGSAINQANLLYATSGTLSASASISIDLAGSVSDFFGNVITFTLVKSIFFTLTTDTTATSVLIGNGSTPFINWVGSGAHTVRVRNGGCFFLSAPDATGYAVTAATGDILKITNEDSSNVATYKLAIVGA